MSSINLGRDHYRKVAEEMNRLARRCFYTGGRRQRIKPKRFKGVKRRVRLRTLREEAAKAVA